MEKLNYVSRISALLLVFVLVGLTGCGTTPQAGGGQSDGGSGTEDSGGAQLAADLGEALSKAASGDTVTLTGRARLATVLIVPSGVIIDLTAEGVGLELRDGAVLTVNGTVNATGHGDHGKGWVEGNLSIGDGTAVITGNGTIYLKSKGRLLNIGSDKVLRQLTLDGVTLVGLPDNDNSLIRINEGGELILKSGAIMGNIFISEEYPSGGGVDVRNKGTFTMEGGEISGNTAKGGKGANGGGVFIGGEGTMFTIKGGKISGNSSNSNGGGVRISSGAVLIMEVGESSGNTVQGGQSSRGGGVDMWEGTFTMSGGVITGNSAGWGGGIYIGSSTFAMEGGEISGNTAQDERAAGGGGVVVNSNGTFTLKGGAVTGNSATRNSALVVNAGTAKWGTGGTYTKGGASQTGGSDIGSTDDTLIAVPGK
jgi:hypothetical protein